MGMYDYAEFHNYEYEDAYAEEDCISTECTCYLEKETDKACLLRIEGMGTAHWFPKTHVRHVDGKKYDISNWLLIRAMQSK